MKNRNHPQLKNNPFVRLIRWVLRLFGQLFRVKKTISIDSNRYESIKVSELFNRVKWQSPESNDK